MGDHGIAQGVRTQKGGDGGADVGKGSRSEENAFRGDLDNGVGDGLIKIEEGGECFEG